MKQAEKITDLSKTDLIKLLAIYAKNWLAHDGCWFLALEKCYGMDSAIKMDIESWRKFTVIEAKRLIAFLKLGTNSGIAGLRKALSFRLYSRINKDEIIKIDASTLEYRVKTCRVQEARRKKGLDDFPCRQVGIVEYTYFASTIDEKFETQVISCPPVVTKPDHHCIWRFILKKRRKKL